MLDPALCHGACEAKDPRFDGVFFVGVTSTGIYCRCICPARTPKRENRTFHLSAAAAEKAGFRPCLLCRPELAPGLAPIDQTKRIAAQALALIEAGALEEQGIVDLAARLGVTDRHLRRVVAETFGASPIELAQTHRLLTAKRLLTETRLPLTEIAFAAGFKSVRRFNALFQSRYGFPPSRIRAKKGAGEAGLRLELYARGAFDGAPLFDYLRRRRLQGVETGSGQTYARTLEIGGRRGWVKIAGCDRGVEVTLSDDLAPALRPALAAVRGAFDLDADVAVIDQALAADPALRALEDPGARIPGGLDPFELAVRAVLGQQVTVQAATTLAQRLVDMIGEPIETPDPALNRLFPSAARIAEAGAERIGKLGMPRARAETLVRLAAAVAEGRITLARGAWAAGREGLSALPGIGPWTVEYVALRGLGDPDAFPAGDAGVRAGLGGARNGAERAEAWRPWRGYATVRLWRVAAAARGERR